ncbi:MAG: hypothetical protein DHS20C18_11190 [Saprospiraceae bacterium]|nr:MAG: hypothetical protein DHS20C18_11190 [Saprospiraceae bacterium]
MSAKTQNERIIFGLKVKHLRQEHHLSFADLARETGMSISYLNEIEKGKKFPKNDKVESLAKVLGVTYEGLISLELDKSLQPVSELLQSNFLNELPLDLFGIELAKVVDIIANAPVRVGAFISTLLELSRNYALREENFYFGALRSYLELHHNYFADIEAAVQRFTEQYDIPIQRPISEKKLKMLLEDRFDYEIVENGIDQYPELANLRSIYLPEKKQLLLNGSLTPMQKAFQFGKELGFSFMGLKERAKTSSILRSQVFEEVLNHSKAIYFSVALHLPLDPFLADMRQFFQKKKWDGEAFLSIMQNYEATPEMFFHRLTNVLPQFFGLSKIFFLRFIHNPSNNAFDIDKELHLSRRHQPHGNGLFEHYCRRWVSLSLLKDLHNMQQEGTFMNTIVRAQHSQYIGTDDEYLCLTIARPAYPEPNRNVSVTIGLLINDELRNKVHFLGDPSIQVRQVNKTCERCTVLDCEVRAAEPTVIQKRDKLHAIQNRLKELSK